MEEGQSFAANAKYHSQTLDPLLFGGLGFRDYLSKWYLLNGLRTIDENKS